MNLVCRTPNGNHPRDSAMRVDPPALLCRPTGDFVLREIQERTEYGAVLEYPVTPGP